MEKFYIGLHQPAHMIYFDQVMISINRIKNRRSGLANVEWLMDSGAFTTLLLNGKYTDSPETYAWDIWKRRHTGKLIGAVAQDYMCEPFMLELTRCSTQEHQRMTIERYDRILAELKRLENVNNKVNTLCPQHAPYLMPVLQGYKPEEYIFHIQDYGKRLQANMWTGVGSVCKRNSNVESVIEVLYAIKSVRPDLRLHGFGLKITALQEKEVRRMLYTSDSMAWSMNERLQGRDPNSYKAAQRYAAQVKALLDLDIGKE